MTRPDQAIDPTPNQLREMNVEFVKADLARIQKALTDGDKREILEIIQ